jgi:hypothetical protein
MAKRGSRRSSRRSSRRGRRGLAFAYRRLVGGWADLSPADVNDITMNASKAQSLQQGADYETLHQGQHGGGAPLIGAPLDTTGLLDPALREAARIQPLDVSYDAIKGMSDMSGGGRRKGGRKSRKASRKSRKARKGSRKARKGSRKGRRGSRRMRGGAMLAPASTDAPGMLLPPDLESKALAALNPEWKLAEDPTSFAPGGTTA